MSKAIPPRRRLAPEGQFQPVEGEGQEQSPEPEGQPQPAEPEGQNQPMESEGTGSAARSGRAGPAAVLKCGLAEHAVDFRVVVTILALHQETQVGLDFVNGLLGLLMDVKVARNRKTLSGGRPESV